MADVFISEDTLTAIGDAIRAKTGETELINTVDMASKIEGIKSENKLNQLVKKTITTLTAEDLQGVTEIQPYLCQKCTALKSVDIPDSVTTIGGKAFSVCRGLISVTIPDSVTTIGDDAFSFCSGLISATIGNSVTTINNYAFANCDSLTSVTIPDSVTTIGGSAFRSCLILAEVIVEGDTVKALGSSKVFSGTPIANGTGYIYIKPTSEDVDEAALVEEYKNATNWSVYAEQIKGYSEYPTEGE